MRPVRHDWMGLGNAERSIAAQFLSFIVPAEPSATAVTSSHPGPHATGPSKPPTGLGGTHTCGTEGEEPAPDTWLGVVKPGGEAASMGTYFDAAGVALVGWGLRVRRHGTHQLDPSYLGVRGMYHLTPSAGLTAIEVRNTAASREDRLS
jgi:hypothetical protein